MLQFPGDVDPKTMGMGVPKKPAATFGQPIGANHPNPTTYLKKHEKEPVLPDPAPPTHPKSKARDRSGCPTAETRLTLTHAATNTTHRQGRRCLPGPRSL